VKYSITDEHIPLWISRGELNHELVEVSQCLAVVESRGGWIYTIDQQTRE